jgi:hypothetical protein
MFALAEQVALASNPCTSSDALEKAIMFIIHLLVDLHQPLHVGKASDDGGLGVPATLERDIGARLNKNGRGSLHKIWDMAVPEYASMQNRFQKQPEVQGKFLRRSESFPTKSPAEIGHKLASSMGPEEEDAVTLKGLDASNVNYQINLNRLFNAIALEVHNLGLGSAYVTGDLKRELGGKLVVDQNYLELQIQTLQRLLSRASHRLAQILNTIAEARVNARC